MADDRSAAGQRAATAAVGFAESSNTHLTGSFGGAEWHNTPMKLLIAVGETPSTTQPPAAIAALLAAATEIQVLSPSLVGPLSWLTGGVDRARLDADDRLNEMLGRLEGLEADAAGTRGDELAGTALSDVLDRFAADHVMLIASSSDRLWQRRKVLDRLLQERGLTVTIALV